VWIALLCVALSQPPAAQSPDPLPARPIAAWAQPIAAERPAQNPLDDETLDTWIHDYTRWREWAEKWLNRRQLVAHPFPYPFWKESPDLFSYVAPRRVEPEPPIGLEAACAQAPRASAGPDRRAQACGLLTIWKDDYATQQIRWGIATARAQKDDLTRTRFLEHIHFASLWTSVQGVGGSQAYGLAGVHATIDVKGRWQVYALPGLLAVSVVSPWGQRMVSIGYDWGMAIRLGGLRLPLADVPLNAHLNVAHVWMPEVEQRLDMVGLSFTVNRGR
jgi:hypothetical protein